MQWHFFYLLIAADGDLDGIPDQDDNCVRVANALQVDSDGDGTGDACDCDDSGTTLCLNDGYCESQDRDYNCYCTIGFSGDQCDIDVDECESSPCLRGSTCVDRMAMYECLCNSETSWGYRCNLTNPTIRYVPNTARSGSVIGLVQGIDAEDFDIKYFSYSMPAISDGPVPPFRIDGTTGELILDRVIFWDKDQSFQTVITVRTRNVQDPQVPVATTTSLTVMIRDRDDPVLQQSPTTFDEYTGKLNAYTS